MKTWFCVTSAEVCPSALGRVTTNDIFMRMLDSPAKEMTT